MDFIIMNASIETVAAGKQNAGDKYVLMTVMLDDMFATKSHKECVFCPQVMIPRWEKAISENALPTFRGTYETIEGLPAYVAENSKFPRTDMTVLVELMPDGKPKYSGRQKAQEILRNVPGIRLVNAEPDTNLGIPPAPAIPAMTPEVIAALKATGVVNNPITGLPF